MGTFMCLFILNCEGQSPRHITPAGAKLYLSEPLARLGNQKWSSLSEPSKLRGGQMGSNLKMKEGKMSIDRAGGDYSGCSRLTQC